VAALLIWGWYCTRPPAFEMGGCPSLLPTGEGNETRQEAEEGNRKVTGRDQGGIRRGCGRAMGVQWGCSGPAILLFCSSFPLLFFHHSRAGFFLLVEMGIIRSTLFPCFSSPLSPLSLFNSINRNPNGGQYRPSIPGEYREKTEERPCKHRGKTEETPRKVLLGMSKAPHETGCFT